ncbi:PaaI family thioesterase, partial [Thioclava sp. BHET1]
MTAMTGLEFLQEVLAGRLPLPTIAGLINYRMSAVAEGRAVFRGTPDFPHTNLMGGVHGGWFGVLLDTAMTCAVMTTLPRGRHLTTLEYKVNLTRALPLGMEVEVEGIVSHAGRTTGVASGTVRGVADGKLYASATTTC